jgi:transcriptional regulator with XRE-family HTH domain
LSAISCAAFASHLVCHRQRWPRRWTFRPSYLNLLEHNQRPLTVSLLLKLGNSFDIDLKSFAEDDSPALLTELAEVFADPLLSGDRVSRRELQDLVTAAPAVARGMLSLFQAYRKVRASTGVVIRRWSPGRCRQQPG